MIGGDSKFVLTRTHTRVPPPPPHTHNSYLETQRDRDLTHSPNGGRDQGKRKDHLVFFPMSTVASQINGKFEVKEEQMKKYLNKVKELQNRFKHLTI